MLDDDHHTAEEPIALVDVADSIARRVLALCELSVAQLEAAPQPLSVDDARSVREAATLLQEAHELLAEIAWNRACGAQP